MRGRHAKNNTVKPSITIPPSSDNCPKSSDAPGQTARFSSVAWD